MTNIFQAHILQFISRSCGQPKNGKKIGKHLKQGDVFLIFYETAV